MSQPDSKSCPFWTIPKCSGRTRKRAAENLEGMCPHQSCLGIPLTPQAAEVEQVRRPGWGSLHVSALGIPQPPLLPHQPGLASREENSLTSLKQRLSSPFVCDPRRNLFYTHTFNQILQDFLTVSIVITFCSTERKGPVLTH